MSLRREATPFSSASLTDEQKNALKEIIEGIDNALENIAETNNIKINVNNKSNPISLQQNRFNNVLFLHGKRGSGKTSTMLSLLRIIQESQNKEHDNDSSDLFINIASSNDSGAFCKRLVPLPPLDMDILPTSSNLLAAILVRLEEPPKRYDQLRSRDHLWLDNDDIDEDSHILDLNQLLRDTSVAMNGNLDERKKSLDPDVFADEQLRNERIRLGFSDRLNRTLEKIVSRFSTERQPLFIMPIDDFDLNPPRCLELLERIHSIRSPYIMFLILGDINIAESILGLQLANNFAKAVGKGESYAPTSHETIKGMVTELTAQARRKLIPPAQVIRLESMTIEEALAFKPLDSNITLISVLSHINLPNLSALSLRQNDHEETITFEDFLTIKDRSNIRAKKNRFIYQGVNFLRTYPRVIYDIYQGLRTVADKKTRRNSTNINHLVEFTFNLCKDAFSEMAASYTERDFYLSLLTRSSDKRPSIDISNLTCIAENSKNISNFSDLPNIVISDCPGWIIQKNNSRESLNILDDRATALLILYHDLLSISKNHTISNTYRPMDLLEVSLSNYLVTGSTLSCNILGNLVRFYYSENNRGITTHLPHPFFITMRQCDQFRTKWNHVINKITLNDALNPEDFNSLVCNGWVISYITTLTNTNIRTSCIEHTNEVFSTLEKTVWDLNHTYINSTNAFEKSYIASNLTSLFKCFSPEFGFPEHHTNLAREILSHLEKEFGNTQLQMTLKRQISLMRNVLRGNLKTNGLGMQSDYFAKIEYPEFL